MCYTRGATGALPAFSVVEIDSLFEDTQVVSTWKHYRRQVTPQLRGEWKKIPTKAHSSGVPRIQVVCMVFKFLTYYAVRKFGGRYKVKQLSRTLLMINAVDNAHRGKAKVSNLSQIIRSSTLRTALRCMRLNRSS